MEKKRKKKNLLHECALLVKEYFRIQKNLFIYLKSKILYLPKKEKKNPKAKAFRTSLTYGELKRREESERRGGGGGSESVKKCIGF